MRNFTFAAVAALALAGCHHDDNKDHDTATCPTDTAVDTADTSVTATCTDSTGTYSVGDTWTCPDGCNTCGCIEPDVIASTDMACADTGGTDTSTPTDTGTSSDTGSGGTDTSTP
jgi:hypothetical protein